MNRTENPKIAASSQFIDTSADVQSEPAAIAVSAGVANLKVLFQNGKITFPVNLRVLTSTGLHRGVHMSRLVRAATTRRGKSLEEWLRSVCRGVNASQTGTRVSCSFEMPYSDQFVKVTVSTTERGAATYEFTATGMTACPCSKKMIGVGHMQRAELTLVLRSKEALDLAKTAGKLEECFSAVPREELKRVQEAKKILEAQDNPKFAEDMVRDCVKRFPNALFVSSRALESIHAHDAIASWSRKPGWVPFL